MEKYFIAKSEQFPNIHLETCYDEEYNFYTTTAISMQNEKMGYITYKFIPKERLAWLCKIETYENFQHRGVATALLLFFEQQARSKRYFKIEGKYYPTNEFAKPFYQKMGYLVEKDGYEQFVGKYLTRENIIPFTVTEIAAPEGNALDKSPER
mgnify:CR=1 FL=1